MSWYKTSAAKYLHKHTQNINFSRSIEALRLFSSWNWDGRRHDVIFFPIVQQLNRTFCLLNSLTVTSKRQSKAIFLRTLLLTGLAAVIALCSDVSMSLFYHSKNYQSVCFMRRIPKGMFLMWKFGRRQPSFINFHTIETGIVTICDICNFPFWPFKNQRHFHDTRKGTFTDGNMPQR